MSPSGKGLAAAFIATSALAPLVLATLRSREVFDVPSTRSSHATPTPRGGGLAIVGGFVVAITFASSIRSADFAVLIAAAVFFGALGFADDLITLSVRFRLAIQLLLAGALSFWVLGSNSKSMISMFIFGVVGLFWVAGYVNVFNFMDGINGLAASSALVAGAAFFLVGSAKGIVSLEVGAAALAGAAAGFLPWNFPRAKFFLGDVGSYSLGAVIAILVLVGWRDHLPPEFLLAPEALFLADATWTLARRIVRGDDWRSAHREHAYQRLGDFGWTHTTVTLTLTLVMAVVTALCALSLSENTAARILGDLAAAMVLVGYLGTPHLLEAREGRG